MREYYGLLERIVFTEPDLVGKPVQLSRRS